MVPPCSLRRDNDVILFAFAKEWTDNGISALDYFEEDILGR